MKTIICCGLKAITGIVSAVISFALLSGIATAMGTPPAPPNIEIQSQEAKLSPMIIGSASVFMIITNTGGSEDSLIGAKLDIPNAVAEIHDTKDGKMVKVEKVQIPSNTTVELKPGSFHIMLFHLPEDIKEGYEFKIHLFFEKSGEKQINVKLTGVDPHSHMHHE
jgi:copper(I)-binding protein